MTIDPSGESRFIAAVRAGAPDECWPWQRALTRAGYGEFMVSGKMHYAHRFAYERAHGEIPKGMYILHSCDNRACCNPDHLRVGTHAENMADMGKRGRALAQAHPERLARGPRNAASKLDEEKVRAIRAASRETAQVALARQYGVSESAISNVLRGESWRHVQ